MAKSKLDWALETAAKGLRVHPLQHTLADGSCSCGNPDCKSVGKHPASANGIKDATLDREQIKAWWKDDPDANIAVHAGPGYVWFDLDVKDGDGIQSLANYLGVDKWDIEDQTFTIRTASGGLHLYYKCEGEIGDRVGVIASVDIRGAGGYVVGAGSNIGDKFYEVICNKPINPLPIKLKQLAESARKKQDQKQQVESDLDSNIIRAREYLKHRKIAVDGKGGNAHTYVTCCHLKDIGLSAETAFELITEPDGWNDRCDGPWELPELQTLLDNAFKYGKDRPGSKASEGFAGMSMEELAGEFIDVKLIETREKLDTEEESVDNKLVLWKKNTYTVNQFRKLEVEYDFIAPDWFPAQGYTAFLATRGVGKTTVILDICMCLASDRNWHKVPLDKGWTVCYIIGEDMTGLKARVNAWCNKFNDGEDISADGKRLMLFDFPIDISNGHEIKAFAEYILKECAGRGKVLFVLDTFQRMVNAGMNEDDAMSTAIGNMEGLARSLTEGGQSGPVFVAFHPPGGNNAKIHGSMVLENASACIIKIENGVNGLKKMAVTRLKGAPETSWMEFRFETVSLGTKDKYGQERTAAVIKPENWTNDPKSIVALKEDERMASLIVKALKASTDLKKVPVRENVFKSLSDVVDLLYAANDNAGVDLTFKAMADAARSLITGFTGPELFNPVKKNEGRYIQQHLIKWAKDRIGNHAAGGSILRIIQKSQGRAFAWASASDLQKTIEEDSKEEYAGLDNVIPFPDQQVGHDDESQ